MTNELICGINPFTISRITYSRFRRWGVHPSWTKVMRKRNPIKGFFGIYDGVLFDGVYSAEVRIYGANGRELKCITCKSNHAAEKLCEELNEQLNEFLSNVKRQNNE